MDQAAQALKETLPYLLGGVAASPVLTGSVLTLESFRFGAAGGLPGTGGFIQRPKSIKKTFKQIFKEPDRKNPRFWKKEVIQALKELGNSSGSG